MSAESAFVSRQLEHIMPSTFDVKYPTLKAKLLIPVDSSAGPGAETITYKQYDMVGAAKLISSYAQDLPRADVKAKEFKSPVRSLGAAFGYNIQEIRAGMQAESMLGGTGGKTLDQRKADAAGRAMAELEDTLAFSGDSTAGLGGFANNANVTTGNAANAISSSSTPDQILAVLNKAVNDVVALTNDLEHPDTMAMPIAQYNYIASTARSANSDTTILEYFLKNNPYIKKIETWYKLKGAGASNTDRMVVYCRDPQHLSLQIPLPVEQLPPEKRGLEWEVALHSRHGGVLFYYPLSASYVDAI